MIINGISPDNYTTDRELNEALKYKGAAIDTFWCGYQIHHLKLAPDFWNQVADGSKTYEIRRNDRAFNPGDVCCFWLWDGSTYKPAVIIADVVGVYKISEVSSFVPIEETDEFVILSIKPKAERPHWLGEYLDLHRRGGWVEFSFRGPWTWPLYKIGPIGGVGFVHWSLAWNSPAPAPWDEKFEGNDVF